MQKCIISYQIGTYSGQEVVYCDENDEHDFIIEKAKQQLRRPLKSLPCSYQSFTVTERETIVDE